MSLEQVVVVQQLGNPGNDKKNIINDWKTTVKAFRTIMVYIEPSLLRQHLFLNIKPSAAFAFTKNTIYAYF